MRAPDLTERIRSIFLPREPFVGTDAACTLLGWSPSELHEALEAGEIELTPLRSGPAVSRPELIAYALASWPLDRIEAALGREGVKVIPAAVRTRRLTARVPGYQAAMLQHLAERDHTTVDHLVARAMDELLGEHYDALVAAIPGFAEAVHWPYSAQTGRAFR